MTPDIFAFVSEKLEMLKDSDYKSKTFDKLKLIIIEAVDNNANGHDTAPGNYSPDVSKKNKGETAFQRALYSKGSGVISEKKVIWCDIELPVTFSNAGRRRCVDLIGRLEGCGDFLCELKYANPDCESLPSSNAPDYAILEALLYYALVKKNQKELHNCNVRRVNHNADFNWADVAKSQVIMVLANDSFWRKAQRNLAASNRICALLNSIHNALKIRVLLCKTPDFNFSRVAGNDGKRYFPQMPSGTEKWETVRFKT